MLHRESPAQMSQASRSFVRLIVNADDFGLTSGVNRAVGELRSDGALTSATLMATGAAFEDAVNVALEHPSLSIGCHVVLVDGVPCCPAESIPTLTGKDGNLMGSLTQFILALQRGRIAEREIEAEAEAQIARIQAAGLRVSHVDTHKHTHLFPQVARPLLRAAVRRGVFAIRNPFEQAWSAQLTRGKLVRKLEVRLLRALQPRFQQLCHEFQVRTTDGSIGVSATGKLDAATLKRLLKNAPPGTWELVCHPGYSDAELSRVKTRLRATRDVEREALATLVPEAVKSGGVQLIGFPDL